MQTITIDGKEYVLVPKEQLREVPKPPENIEPDPPQSVLSDFLGESGMDTPLPPVDDGLQDNKEKQEAIKITIQDDNPQDIVTRGVTAPKAQPRPYLYRERFLKKELLPTDIMTFSRMSTTLLEGNPEDPFIKADAKKPKSQRLFYGPGSEQEG